MTQRPQEQDAGAPAVRPEDQELPTRLQDAMELAEDLLDLLPMKMLEHTEVVDSVERPLLERQVEDARLLDPTRARVVTGIEPQRPLGDVDGGHADSLMEASVHLSAAASGVEDARALGERSLYVPAQVAPDQPAIDGGDEVVEGAERRSLLAPVLVPALRLTQLGTQLVDQAGSQEIPGVRQACDEQLQQKPPAPEALPGRELGASIHPGRKHDRDLSDAAAVTMENEEALEEERVGASRHELEELTRDPSEIVEPERAAGIVGHAEERPRQEMPEPRQEQAVATPAGEAGPLEIARGHHDGHVGGVRGQQAGGVGRGGRKNRGQGGEQGAPPPASG